MGETNKHLKNQGLNFKPDKPHINHPIIWYDLKITFAFTTIFLHAQEIELGLRPNILGTKP